MNRSRTVEIVEVGARDGLQNQKEMLSTDQKVQFIEQMVDAGIRRMEATSFVNPKRVPQMADADDVMARVPRDRGVTYIGLALNVRGAQRAIDAGCDQVGVAIPASSTFGIKNQGQNIDEMLATWAEIAKTCRDAGVPSSIMIAAAYGCPFEGEVPLETVFMMAERAVQEQPIELAFADTIGVGDPLKTAQITERFREIAPNLPIRAHLHNTRNTGLANAYAALEAGIGCLDASFGGIGGCPFAPAATGNIPTEDLVYMLDRMGVETGIDAARAAQSGLWVGEALGIDIPAYLGKAGGFPEPQAQAAE